jgi:hypothetical protein
MQRIVQKKDYGKLKIKLDLCLKEKLSLKNKLSTWKKNKMEGNKMVFNVDKSKMQEALQAGIVTPGVIISVKDGIVRDFVNSDGISKWNNPDQMAIEVASECQFNGEVFRDTKILPYRNDEQGNTVYGERSNLGKFSKYYKKLPQINDQIQMKTNSEGFFKLVIE